MIRCANYWNVTQNTYNFKEMNIDYVWYIMKPNHPIAACGFHRLTVLKVENERFVEPHTTAFGALRCEAVGSLDWLAGYISRLTITVWCCAMIAAACLAGFWSLYSILHVTIVRGTCLAAIRQRRYETSCMQIIPNRVVSCILSMRFYEM